MAKKNKGGTERSRAELGEKYKSSASPLFWDVQGGLIVATQLFKIKSNSDGAPDVCSEV